MDVYLAGCGGRGEGPRREGESAGSVAFARSCGELCRTGVPPDIRQT